MKRILKIILGSILALCGTGLILSGGYLLFHDRNWNAAGIFLLFASFGFLIAFTGYDLARGRSIKDDLFFLFFN